MKQAIDWPRFILRWYPDLEGGIILTTDIGILRSLKAVALSSLLVLGLGLDAKSAAVSTRERLKEAVAASRLCKNLRVNQRVFDRVAREVGMDPTHGSRDMREFEMRVKQQVPRLLKFDRAIICGLGEYDFGPNGVNVKGLLKVLSPTPPIKS